MSYRINNHLLILTLSAWFAGACSDGSVDSMNDGTESVARTDWRLTATSTPLAMQRGVQLTAFGVTSGVGGSGPSVAATPTQNPIKIKDVAKLCDPAVLQVRADGLCESLVVELYADIEGSMGVECSALCHASNVSYDKDCNVTAGHCDCEVTCS